MRKIGFTLLILLILALPVAAQETTPEATEEPRFGWVTPTPIPVGTPVIAQDNLLAPARSMAEMAVTGWQAANHSGALDGVLFFVVLFLIVRGTLLVFRDMMGSGEDL